MNAPFSFVTIALLSLTVPTWGTLGRRVGVHNRCNPDINPTEVCSADGVLFVKTIDDRRILIAIDTDGVQKPEGAEKSDGLVDHLFLYTASKPYNFRATDEPFPGHVEYGQGMLRVVGKDGRQSLLFLVRNASDKSVTRLHAGERKFDHSIGLSHYGGWHGLRIARLSALRPSSRCESSPDACFEVDEIRIEFPA